MVRQLSIRIGKKAVISGILLIAAGLAAGRDADPPTGRGAETSSRPEEAAASRPRTQDELAARRWLLQLQRGLRREARCAFCAGRGRGNYVIASGANGAGERRRRVCPQCRGLKTFPSPEYLRRFVEFDAELRLHGALAPDWPGGHRDECLAMIGGWPAVAAVNAAAEAWVDGRFERRGESVHPAVIVIERIGLHAEPDGTETPVAWGRLIGRADPTRLHLLTAERSAGLAVDDLAAVILEDRGRRHYVLRRGYDPLTATMHLAELRRLETPE